MTLLLKNGQTVENRWLNVDDDTAALPEGPIVVSLERWRRDRAAISIRNTPLGIRLKSHQLAPEIADDLERFSLVVLEFPKFRDGRAFSTARELRERHGFTGEIRAVGHLIPDQYQFLVRTGFTSVEVPPETTLTNWQRALSDISVAYQSGVLDDTPVSLLRRKVNAHAP